MVAKQVAELSKWQVAAANQFPNLRAAIPNGTMRKRRRRRRVDDTGATDRLSRNRKASTRNSGAPKWHRMMQQLREEKRQAGECSRTRVVLTASEVAQDSFHPPVEGATVPLERTMPPRPRSNDQLGESTTI